MIVELGSNFEKAATTLGARALYIVGVRYEENQNPEYDFNITE